MDINIETLSCLRALPVSINNVLGDPFISAQVEDTFSKLDDLGSTGHSGPISIITKFPFDDALLSRLSSYSGLKNLIVFYTMTGFSEGGMSFAQRLKVYERLSAIVPNTVLLFRPIIEGRNDSDKIIRTMLAACRQTATCLVYTGFYVQRGQNRYKYLSKKTEAMLVRIAEEVGVKVFPKSSCATQHLLGGCCFTHVDGAPLHLPVLRRFYLVDENEAQPVVRNISAGDRNFIRFICHANVSVEISASYHFLTILSPGPLLCSSSWFSWSRIVDCSIKCWYCSTEYVFPECKQPESIGCNPSSLAHFV
jgi:hypothetical protein